MFYLFLAVYSMGVDVAGVVFYSELFPNHIRAKGVCLSMATVALTDLVYLQATTTAFANIGWRFYLVRNSFYLDHQILQYTNPARFSSSSAL